MPHVNLYVKIGRGDRRCVGTFEGSKEVADTAANHAQAGELAALQSAGNAAARIEFSREAVGYNKKGA